MTGQIKLKYNPDISEIRTRSVEEQLEPLVRQVTTLVNTDDSRKKGKGKSKTAPVLVAAVEKATQNFIEKGEQIANENPVIMKDMLAAVEEIRKTGNIMSEASHEFAQNPCDSARRVEMIRAARSLLGAVVRLLILADMIDVDLLLKSVESIEATLERIRTSKPNQLDEELEDYFKKSHDLSTLAAKRQQEITDPQLRDDLASARAVLKKSSAMLLSSTKAYVAHSDVPAAKANRDHVLKQICRAVDTINHAAQGKTPNSSSGKFEETGRLANNLDTLINPDVLNYKEVRTKALLEQQLEELTNGAIRISESAGVRDERKNKIFNGCEAVKEALQSLLNQSMKSRGEKESNEMEKALYEVSRKAGELRRQLRKAVADEISERFLNTTAPLLALVAAAEKGDVDETETRANDFHEYCCKLIEVANRVCDLSNNKDGIKMVRYASTQVSLLCPAVINAARLLAERPQSAAAKESMNAFKQQWECQVQLLLDAVDDITTIDDVLSVLDNHMYDDINKYIEALHKRDPHSISDTAYNIKGRSKRITDIVEGEMDNYEPCAYTKRVLEAIKVLNKEMLPNFDQKTEKIIQTLSKNPQQDFDENEFIDATRLIYDGIRDVRRAVLMNRNDEELDPEEVEFESSYATDALIKTITQTRTDEIIQDKSAITAAVQAMNKLPEQEKNKLMTQVENFQSEKITFDREVAKWDDAGNDIVVIAKYMCLIMMYMTDFVRQRGPLKTIADVINAAKQLSAYGTQLDKLTKQIAEQCPESSTKNDLLAYIERISLYSHQINLIAKVKAGVQTNEDGDEENLILTGLESATSLIENAKNLMNAVVLTVKASYVASTKYSRQGSLKIVVWKMKIPEKKPLVRLEKSKEVRTVVRKSSQRKTFHPVKVLADFQI